MEGLIYVFDTRNLSGTKVYFNFLVCLWVLSTIGTEHADALWF